MPALALVLALCLAAPKGHGPWLREWVSGEVMPASPEAIARAELEARRRSNFAWRDGDPTAVGKLRRELELTLANASALELQRLRAARVLGWMRQPEAVPALAAALAAGPVKVREEAAAALRHFGATDVKYTSVGNTGAVVTELLENVADPRATTALAQATGTAEAKVRRAALRALLHHQGEEVVAAALDAARAGRDAVETVPLLVREAPADLEPLLLAYAKSEDPVVRAAGTRGLGHARLASARPRLLELLDDASPLVFAATHSALRELAGFPPVQMPEDAALDRAILISRWKALKR